MRLTGRKKELTAQEIQGIIESCAAAKVRVFEHAGLRLEFGESKQASVDVTSPPASEPTSQTDAALSARHESQNQESLEIDELRLKEERLALMRIEDPLEYERLLTEGELEHSEGAIDLDE